MKTWVISDTHAKHFQLDVPDGIECVIHCGDESNSPISYVNEGECLDFLAWWMCLPIEHKIFVPGNHSIALAAGLLNTHPAAKAALINESTSVEGMSVWGSPYTPSFGSWAYMCKRNRMDILWRNIPDSLDILVTHGPPKGILDRTYCRDTKKMISVGCKALRNRVEEVRPAYHFFGHIHTEPTIDNHGIFKQHSTTFVNASVTNIKGEVIHNGFVLDL